LAKDARFVVDYGAPNVARITIRRPEKRNALDVDPTRVLHCALIAASNDQQVRPIILAAEGGDFCSGHDLSDSLVATEEKAGFIGHAPLAVKDVDGFFEFERELFSELTGKWWILTTPTIAVVQGRFIVGGVAVALACSVIVAGAGAPFDYATVMLGACGPGHFAYPWDLGTKAANYLLFTGSALTAAEALRMGLVAEVHPAGDLMSSAINLTIRIAAKHAFALRITKEAINLAADISARRAAMQVMFPTHQLCHADNFYQFGLPIDPRFLSPDMMEAGRLSVKANGILTNDVLEGRHD